MLVFRLLINYQQRIRPNKKYITNRKDLDGGALAIKRGPSLQDKIAYVGSMFVNPTASWGSAFRLLGSQGLKGITDNVKHYRGKGFDIQEQLQRLENYI